MLCRELASPTRSAVPKTPSRPPTSQHRPALPPLPAPSLPAFLRAKSFRPHTYEHPSHLPQNSQNNSFISTTYRRPSSKSFRTHTYAKTGGGGSTSLVSGLWSLVSGLWPPRLSRREKSLFDLLFPDSSSLRYLITSLLRLRPRNLISHPYILLAYTPDIYQVRVCKYKPCDPGEAKPNATRF